MQITITHEDLSNALAAERSKTRASYCERCLVAQAGIRQDFHTGITGGGARRLATSFELMDLIAVFDGRHFDEWAIPMLEAALPLTIEVQEQP